MNLSDLETELDSDLFEFILDSWNQDNFKTCFDGRFPKYRSLNKAACPLGYIIDKSEYNAALMEKHSWTELAGRGVVPNAHVEMLQAIQDLHDAQFSEKDMEVSRLNILKGLSRISRKFFLGFSGCIEELIEEYQYGMEHGFDN